MQRGLFDAPRAENTMFSGESNYDLNTLSFDSFWSTIAIVVV